MTGFDFDDKVDGHHDVAITLLRRTLRKLEAVTYENLTKTEMENIIYHCRSCVLSLENLYEDVRRAVQGYV